MFGLAYRIGKRHRIESISASHSLSSFPDAIVFDDVVGNTNRIRSTMQIFACSYQLIFFTMAVAIRAAAAGAIIREHPKIGIRP